MMGDELRKLRESAGLTQEQLSFKAGLSRPYVSQLERSLKSRTVDTRFRICDALEVSAANVIKRVDAERKRKQGVRAVGSAGRR
jgi:transcriptional regulator with XRE-family HTH domain